MPAQTSKKILIVEDEAPLLKALSEKLAREGFVAVQAKNGELGLQAAYVEKPDLILLDNVMPVMDGLTMMRKLRERDEWGRSVPIIILTNLAADDAIMASVMRDTPSYYLLKAETTPDTIVEKIRERLDMAT